MKEDLYTPQKIQRLKVSGISDCCKVIFYPNTFFPSKWASDSVGQQRQNSPHLRVTPCKPVLRNQTAVLHTAPSTHAQRAGARLGRLTASWNPPWPPVPLSVLTPQPCATRHPETPAPSRPFHLSLGTRHSAETSLVNQESRPPDSQSSGLSLAVWGQVPSPQARFVPSLPVPSASPTPPFPVLAMRREGFPPDAPRGQPHLPERRAARAEGTWAREPEVSHVPLAPL